MPTPTQLTILWCYERGVELTANKLGAASELSGKDGCLRWLGFLGAEEEGDETKGTQGGVRGMVGEGKGRWFHWEGLVVGVRGKGIGVTGMWGGVCGCKQATG